MTIAVDDFVLRQAIGAFKELLRLPVNRATQTKARIAVENLEAHLPEVIEAAIMAQECEHQWWAHGTALSPPTILVQCACCRCLGTTTEFTDEQWKEAFWAPSQPFRWEGAVEKIGSIAGLVEGIPDARRTEGSGRDPL